MRRMTLLLHYPLQQGELEDNERKRKATLMKEIKGLKKKYQIQKIIIQQVKESYQEAVFNLLLKLVCQWDQWDR
jgi:hypothetical protein